jgi:Mg2+/citrate symporter
MKTLNKGRNGLDFRNQWPLSRKMMCSFFTMFLPGDKLLVRLVQIFLGVVYMTIDLTWMLLTKEKKRQKNKSYTFSANKNDMKQKVSALISESEKKRKPHIIL